MVQKHFICQKKKNFLCHDLITLAFKQKTLLLLTCAMRHTSKWNRIFIQWWKRAGFDLIHQEPIRPWKVLEKQSELNVSLQWIVENFWNTKVKDSLLVTNFNFYFIKHLWKQTNACNGCQAVGKSVFLTPY